MFPKANISFITIYDFGIYKFKRSLFQDLKKKGYEIYVIAPPGKYKEIIEKDDVKVINFNMDKSSISPFRELKSFFEIFRILKSIRPNLLVLYDAKPRIYGAIAGRVLKIKNIISVINGLGYIFTPYVPMTLKLKLIKKVYPFLLRLIGYTSNKLVFLNQDDITFFKNKKIINEEKTVVIKGEGIDTNFYSPFKNVDYKKIQDLKREMGINDDENKIIITMISRMIWSKGVLEFVNAAKKIKKHFNDKILFLLIGNIDEVHPDKVNEAFLREATEKGFVKWLGFRTDIREILYISDIFVLPSYYREGIPESILEAMAMGKPIVTTNSPGCRDTVENGIDGFLIPPKDTKALANALEKLIADESLRAKMGLASRQKALRDFSTDVINEQWTQLINELTGGYDRL